MQNQDEDVMMSIRSFNSMLNTDAYQRWLAKR